MATTFYLEDINEDELTQFISQLPETEDLEVQERYLRMDYFEDSDGIEWYSIFATNGEDLFQISPWRDFENTWMSYQDLFTSSEVEEKAEKLGLWGRMSRSIAAVL